MECHGPVVLYPFQALVISDRTTAM